METKKELKTLEEKYNYYAGRNFSLRQHKEDSNDSAFIDFKVVGFVEENNNFLIGLLNPNCGISPHFTEPTNLDNILGHQVGNMYLYVNLSRLEKNPETKKFRKRKELENVGSISFQ